jgi:hypothetical protein
MDSHDLPEIIEDALTFVIGLGVLVSPQPSDRVEYVELQGVPTFCESIGY